MAKETETTEPAADATASSNMTLAQLGERMAKGRKAPSASKPAPAAAETATPETSSEQAESGEAKPDLSHPETDDSAALAAEATAEQTDAGPDDDPGTVHSDEGEVEGAAAAEGEPAKPKAVRDLQKRVGRVTEQRNELREENAELKARLAGLEKSAPQPKAAHVADGTFDGERNVQEATEALAGVRAFLKWADANPDGGSFSEDGKTYELSAEDVRSYRRQSEEESIRLHTKREARLERLRADFDTQRAATHAEAVKLYPWIEQKASAEFQEALAVIRENPGVLKRADFELIVARQVAGQRLEREALKKAKAGQQAGKPAGQRPVTPVVTFSPTAARKAASGEQNATVSAAEKQFKDGGGREGDLSKLLAQKRLARLEAAKA